MPTSSQENPKPRGSLRKNQLVGIPDIEALYRKPAVVERHFYENTLGKGRSNLTFSDAYITAEATSHPLEYFLSDY